MATKSGLKREVAWQRFQLHFALIELRACEQLLRDIAESDPEWRTLIEERLGKPGLPGPDYSDVAQRTIDYIMNENEKDTNDHQ